MEVRNIIEYEDFSLKIEPKRGDLYPVIVLRSPAGEGRSSFRLPFDPDELGDILFQLGQTVRGSGQVPLRDISPAATRTRPQQIGDQLFNTLFSGPVRSLLDRSLGMLHGRQRGLRIKLHIDQEDPGLAHLASLPWEFLYRKETRDFLNLSRFTPILRYLDVQRPYTPLPLEPPLRILVVISDPYQSDCAKLDLDRERALIEASWAKQEGVQVEFMQRSTIFALQDRLGEQPYHVLHYMGHGDFDERAGQGVLVMEDEEGREAMVDGSTLGVLLRDVPTMRLVFLNACETARISKDKGLDPFAGVAAAMVMAGIPAVVAMQFPISDTAAITFAQKFYPLLARGEPVDAAVAEGRRAIRLADARTMEWGTPVLFMRAPQGVIFEVSEVQREKVPLPEIPELPEEVDERLESRLAELYTRGLSAFWLEEWEKAASSFQAIVDVRADYEDAANKLAEAQRQAKLHSLYTQAQSAQGAEDWAAALTTLEELVAEAPDYRDAAAMLDAVKEQKQLADLYAEAQRLHQAQQWQAIVNVFAQIHAIEPDHADPDNLLSTAEQELAEQRRQARLNQLYSHAVREMEAKRWQDAHQLLIQVQEIEPGFHETERLLARVEAEIEREEAERQRQSQIAALYEQALASASAERWEQVLKRMEEIQALDPRFADLEGITAKAQSEIERQQWLNAQYAQAQDALRTEDWDAALAALQDLVTEAAGFRDATDLLALAHRKKQVADLYDQVRRLYQAQQWQAVVDTFAQICTIEPGCPDPEELLPKAEQELLAQKRQMELDHLYSRAVRQMDGREWARARRFLEQAQQVEPGYRDTDRLLAVAEAEIEREEAQRQRQDQIATLYEQALGLARARQWRQVVAKMEGIQTLDSQFDDPEGLAIRAREEVMKEEEEARRQNELAALYAQAVQLLKAGEYQEALEKWDEVRLRDPRYPDRQKVQAKARKKLAALGKGARGSRSLPRWAIAVVGGLGVIAVVTVVVLRGCLPGIGTSEVNPTSAPVVAAVDATPADTQALPTSVSRPLDPWDEVIVPPGGSVNLAFVSVLSGEWAPAGEAQKNAFLLAVEDAGAIRGFPLAVPAIEDSGCNAEMSESAAKTVTSDPSIVGLVGPWCSVAYEAAAPVYEGANLVVISPGCMMPDLTERGSEVFNRVVTRTDRDGYEVDSQVVDTTSYQEFASRYQSRYGQPIPQVEADDRDWGYQAVYAYDAAGILIQSIEQVAEIDDSGNLVIGRQALARAVRATAGYQGVTGVISFDEKGDRLSGSVPPTLDLRVAYDHDWVESFYEAGHTVWITVAESDGVTVKATVMAITKSRSEWDGETGFQTEEVDWDPSAPDIQPYDWVYASVDNGVSSQVQIGEISEMIDFEADSVEGTINAPWFSNEVRLECFFWGVPAPGPDVKNDSVLPDGQDRYSCSWATEWNMQLGEDPAVGYIGPDGHWVANSLHTNARIVASSEGDFLWTTEFSPYASLTISIYESKDPGAILLWEGSRAADQHGFALVEPPDHPLDLEPGNYLTVSDDVARKGLVLEAISMNTFDIVQDFVAGTAPPGTDVEVAVGTQEYESRMTVLADPGSGAWTADFTDQAFDISEEMRPGSFAQVHDNDGDSNEAGAPPP